MQGKRLIVSFLLAALVGLAAASAATADASWSLETRTGFLGRGDVIAAVGKLGLVPSPQATLYLYRSGVRTCVFSDGSQSVVPDSAYLLFTMTPIPRFAPGSQTISGYQLPAPTRFEGGGSEASLSTCFGLAFRNGVTLVDAPLSDTPWVPTLYYSYPGSATSVPILITLT